MPQEDLVLRAQANRVYVSGAVRVQDFRNILATLHSVVVDRGYQDIILDFSECKFVLAPPMLSIICQCMAYRHNVQADVSLLLPEDEVIRRLFLNSNWAHLID